MQKNQYYSIVTDRISDLEYELEMATRRLKRETDIYLIEKISLEISVIKAKIKHLEKIKLLPLYLSLTCLKNAQIFEEGKPISFDELLNELGLDETRSIVNKKNITTLSYLKELFVGNMDEMFYLLKLQETNFTASNRISLLYSQGENSIAQINIRERKLNRLEESFNSVTESLENDYAYDTLKEISHYIRFGEEKLSREFILKHKDKVLSYNPKMAKALKKLERGGKFKFINKLFNKNRDNNEKMFIDSLLGYYNNDSRLSNLGLTSNPEMLSNSHSIKKFIKNLNGRINDKREELRNTREEINSARTSTMNEIRTYEGIRDEKKARFMALLKSKTNFLPKIFAEQLWNEPELRYSLVNMSVIEEQNSLMSVLSAWNQPSTIYQENTHVDISIRRLVA